MLSALASALSTPGLIPSGKIGTSPVVIGCAVIAILALVLRVVLDKKLAIAADAMSVVAGITLVVAAAQFISPRVNTHRLDHDLYEQRPDDG